LRAGAIAFVFWLSFFAPSGESAFVFAFAFAFALALALA
jgi:hypothetical protein